MTLSPLLWPFVLFSYRVFLPGNGSARGGDPDVMAEDALFRGYWPGLGLSARGRNSPTPHYLMALSQLQGTRGTHFCM